MEFVRDQFNGYIIPEDPQKVAQIIDKWYEDRILTREMGENGYKTVSEKNINWDYVIDKLLGIER